MQLLQWNSQFHINQLGNFIHFIWAWGHKVSNVQGNPDHPILGLYVRFFNPMLLLLWQNWFHIFLLHSLNISITLPYKTQSYVYSNKLAYQLKCVDIISYCCRCCRWLLPSPLPLGCWIPIYSAAKVPKLWNIEWIYIYTILSKVCAHPSE